MPALADVFTDVPHLGNPVAVVLDGNGCPPSRCQASPMDGPGADDVPARADPIPGAQYGTGPVEDVIPRVIALGPNAMLAALSPRTGVAGRSVAG